MSEIDSKCNVGATFGATVRDLFSVFEAALPSVPVARWLGKFLNTGSVDSGNLGNTLTAPGGAVTTTVRQSCCGFTVGTKNALGHGSVVNRDSAGRTVHTATLEDFDSHTNLLNPLDSKTFDYDPAGRMVKATLESGKSQTTVYAFSGVVDKIEYRDASENLVGTDDFTYDDLLRRTAATSPFLWLGDCQRLDL